MPSLDLETYTMTPLDLMAFTMTSQSNPNQAQLLQKSDVDAAPMSQDHKCRVLRRFRRLRKILAQTDQRNVEQHTNKKNAREGLARMKVMHNIYMTKLANGDFDIDDKDDDDD